MNFLFNWLRVLWEVGIEGSEINDFLGRARTFLDRHLWYFQLKCCSLRDSSSPGMCFIRLSVKDCLTAVKPQALNCVYEVRSKYIILAVVYKYYVYMCNIGEILVNFVVDTTFSSLLYVRTFIHMCLKYIERSVKVALEVTAHTLTILNIGCSFSVFPLQKWKNRTHHEIYEDFSAIRVTTDYIYFYLANFFNHKATWLQSNSRNVNWP